MTDALPQLCYAHRLGLALRKRPSCPGTTAAARRLGLVASAWSVLRRTGGVQHYWLVLAAGAAAAVASSSLL